MKLMLVAVGKLRGEEAALYEDYAKRITGGLFVRTIVASGAKAENAALLAALPPKAFVVALDERGEDLSSVEMAAALRAWQESGASALVFVIGGAEGLNAEIRGRANVLLSLGRKTWPHKLARVLLVEQLYRAQQILAGHPYHRA